MKTIIFINMHICVYVWYAIRYYSLKFVDLDRAGWQAFEYR